MTKEGFFSVVRNRNDHDQLLVRARARKDLENLCRAAGGLAGFKDSDIIGPGGYSDYRWRLFVGRSEWQQVLAGLTDDLDYDNFKNAVATRDQERARTYMDVWSIMHRVQENEEAAGG